MAGNLHPLRLLYSATAWRNLFASGLDHLVEEHVECNYTAVAPFVRPRARVLDIGAWDCALLQKLRDRTGADVCGVDIVDENRSDLPFRVFDGRSLPFSNGQKFDVVLLLYVLHHAADHRSLLEEARRVVADDGFVLIGEDRADTFWQRLFAIVFHVGLWAATSLGWEGRFRSVASWREEFERAGLETLDVIDLGRPAGRRWMPRNVLFLTRRSRAGTEL